MKPFEPWLGIMLEPCFDADSDQRKPIQFYTRITSVEEGSAAQKAGLKVGDIVLEIKAADHGSTASQISPADAFEVTARRNGKVFVVIVTTE